MDQQCRDRYPFAGLQGGNLRVHERFIRWDKGHGYSFAVYEASVPVFRRTAENYEAAGEGAVATPLFEATAVEEPTAMVVIHRAYHQTGR